MIRQYFKIARLLLIVSALLTFVGLPLISIYGWIRPWPEAEAALRQHGITGKLIMVGGSWSSRQSSNAAGQSWSKEQTRTYIAAPESFRSGELFTYSEASSSGMDEVRIEMTRQKQLLWVVVIWLLAAIASVAIVVRWLKRRAHSHTLRAT
jgi:hypothetical protein